MEPLGNYDALEETILDEVEKLRSTHFGNAAFEFSPTDSRMEEINRKVTELLKDFPADNRGNRFLGCYLVIQPILAIAETHLKSSLEADVPSNLFPKEIGKKISLSQQVNPQLGVIFNENTIKLHNIRVKEGQALRALLKPNKPLPTQTTFATDGARINAPLGQTAPSRIKMLADLIIGTATQTDCEFEAEMDEKQAIIYHIPLPKISGKIRYDRFVKLSNGKSGMLEDFGIQFTGGGVNIKSDLNVRFNLEWNE